MNYKIPSGHFKESEVCHSYQSAKWSFAGAAVIQNDTEFKSQVEHEMRESLNIRWMMVLGLQWAEESPGTPVVLGLGPGIRPGVHEQF